VHKEKEFLEMTKHVLETGFLSVETQLGARRSMGLLLMMFIVFEFPAVPPRKYRREEISEKWHEQLLFPEFCQRWWHG